MTNDKSKWGGSLERAHLAPIPKTNVACLEIDKFSGGIFCRKKFFSHFWSKIGVFPPLFYFPFFLCILGWGPRTPGVTFARKFKNQNAEERRIIVFSVWKEGTLDVFNKLPTRRKVAPSGPEPKLFSGQKIIQKLFFCRDSYRIRSRASEALTY